MDSTLYRTHEPHPSVAGSVQFIKDIREQIGKVVVGQDVVVERLLIALFTGGHLLLQGVPGLAKTLLVAALSKTIDLSFARIVMAPFVFVAIEIPLWIMTWWIYSIAFSACC